MNTKLYFAYGSNLNIDQMARRCPDADPICQLMLKDWKLVFRGVADVVPFAGATVGGGLWRISAADEAKLDLYEGVRGGLYRKVYLPIRFEGLLTTMLMYVMNSDGIYPPSQGYLDGIREGYKHFQLDERLLDVAVTESWDDKRPSRMERERSARYGWPKLARPKHCDNCGFCPRKEKKEKKGETRLLPFVFANGRKEEPARCKFEWRGGRCAREQGHRNGHRIQ